MCVHSDGTERQSIKDVDSAGPRPKIRACSIADPYVLIVREDDTIGLFIETDRAKIRRKDMSPMGDKVGGMSLSILTNEVFEETSRYLTGCFFTDHTGLFQSALENVGAPPGSAVSEKPTSTLQNVMGPATRTQWLLLVRPQGVVEVWLPLYPSLRRLLNPGNRYGRSRNSSWCSQRRDWQLCKL